MLYNLIDYGNECIEKITTNRQVTRNSLSLIDAYTNEKIILRQEFDTSEEGGY